MGYTRYPVSGGSAIIIPGTTPVSGGTPNGVFYEDSSGTLITNNAAFTTDDFGNVTLESIVGNNGAWTIDPSGDGAFSNLTSDGTLVVLGTSSLDGGSITTDGSGDLQASSLTASFSVQGATLSFDGGNFTSDGSGGVHAVTLNLSGTFTDVNSIAAVDANQRILFDESGESALTWNLAGRTLVNIVGTTQLTWSGASIVVGTSLNSPFFSSQSANLATAGVVRLANTDLIEWRNGSNGSNLTLGVSSTNNLQYVGVDLVTTSNTETLTNKTLTSPIISNLTPTAGVVLNSSTGTLSSTAGPLPVANGGTGSATQNYVDLTTAQTAAGAKTFSTAPIFSSLTTAGVLLNSVTTGQVTSTAGALPLVNGGTAKTSVTTAPAATSWAGWDANQNITANSFIPKLTSTATAAGTTTLVVGSASEQVFTGTTTQTVVLPVATTLANGMYYQIVNDSTGVVTVNTSGAATIQAMASGTVLNLTCTNTAGGTGTASWTWTYLSANTGLGLTNPMTTGGDIIYGGTSGVPTRLANGTSGQILTSSGTTVAPTWKSSTMPTVTLLPGGTAGTYNSPAGVLYLVIEAVSPGAGGGGSGISGASVGSNGTGTIFGTVTLGASTGGGLGNASSDGAGGVGAIFSGTAYGTILLLINGQPGAAGYVQGTSVAANAAGGSGGNSQWGLGGYTAHAGSSSAGTGYGAGGSGGTGSASTFPAGGGGGGAYIKMLAGALSSISYSVSSGGAGGTSGGAGAGAAGTDGRIIITEYYS